MADAELQLTYSPREGILLHGNTKPYAKRIPGARVPGVQPMRFSARLPGGPGWYVPLSRDKSFDRSTIEALGAELAKIATTSVKYGETASAVVLPESLALKPTDTLATAAADEIKATIAAVERDESVAADERSQIVSYMRGLPALAGDDLYLKPPTVPTYPRWDADAQLKEQLWLERRKKLRDQAVTALASVHAAAAFPPAPEISPSITSRVDHSSVAAKLEAQAKKLAADAESKLHYQGKENTPKRAREADSRREGARRQLGIAETMKAIAGRLRAGEPLEYVSRISTKADVETLEQNLRLAGYARARAEGRASDYQSRDAEIADVDFAELNTNTAHARALRDAIEAIPAGKAKAARRVLERAKLKAPTNDDWTTITEAEADALREAVKAMAKVPYSVENVMERVRTSDRLRRLGIVDTKTLRAALREYMGCCRGGAKQLTKEDQARARRKALQFAKIPGFFPTPRELAERAVDLAEIQPGDLVLEPSAGSGAIADVIRKQHPDATLEVVEYNSTLRKLLTEEGFNLVGSDFMAFEGGPYDAIVMNPPFEDRGDTKQVAHALTMLKPGGRIAAIVSGSFGSRTDQATRELRAELEKWGAVLEPLPPGTFKESGTDVGTMLIWATKPAARRETSTPTPTRPPAVAPAAVTAKERTTAMPTEDDERPRTVAELESAAKSGRPIPLFGAGGLAEAAARERSYEDVVLSIAWNAWLDHPGRGSLFASPSEIEAVKSLVAQKRMRIIRIPEHKPSEIEASLTPAEAKRREAMETQPPALLRISWNRARPKRTESGFGGATQRLTAARLRPDDKLLILDEATVADAKKAIAWADANGITVAIDPGPVWVWKGKDRDSMSRGGELDASKKGTPTEAAARDQLKGMRSLELTKRATPTAKQLEELGFEKNPERFLEVKQRYIHRPAKATAPTKTDEWAQDTGETVTIDGFIYKIARRAGPGLVVDEFLSAGDPQHVHRGPTPTLRSFSVMSDGSGANASVEFFGDVWVASYEADGSISARRVPRNGDEYRRRVAWKDEASAKKVKAAFEQRLRPYLTPEWKALHAAVYGQAPVAETATKDQRTIAFNLKDVVMRGELMVARPTSEAFGTEIAWSGAPGAVSWVAWARAAADERGDQALAAWDKYTSTPVMIDEARVQLLKIWQEATETLELPDALDIRGFPMIRDGGKLPVPAWLDALGAAIGRTDRGIVVVTTEPEYVERMLTSAMLPLRRGAARRKQEEAPMPPRTPATSGSLFGPEDEGFALVGQRGSMSRSTGPERGEQTTLLGVSMRPDAAKLAEIAAERRATGPREAGTGPMFGARPSSGSEADRRADLDKIVALKERLRAGVDSGDAVRRLGEDLERRESAYYAKYFPHGSLSEQAARAAIHEPHGLQPDRVVVDGISYEITKREASNVHVDQQLGEPRRVHQGPGPLFRWLVIGSDGSAHATIEIGGEVFAVNNDRGVISARRAGAREVPGDPFYKPKKAVRPAQLEAAKAAFGRMLSNYHIPTSSPPATAAERKAERDRETARRKAEKAEAAGPAKAKRKAEREAATAQRQADRSTKVAQKKLEQAAKAEARKAAASQQKARAEHERLECQLRSQRERVAVASARASTARVRLQGFDTLPDECSSKRARASRQQRREGAALALVKADERHARELEREQEIEQRLFALKEQLGMVRHPPTRMIEGNATFAIIPSAKGTPRRLPARFVLVEAEGIVPSHDATTFNPRSDYPPATQERPYESSQAEQLKVMDVAKNMAPELLQNTNPGSVDGTPIVDQERITISGNGRAMGAQRHYRSAKPDAPAILRPWLIANAAQFGFSGAQVRSFERPLVVRMINIPASERARLVRDTNEALTQRLGAGEEAAAKARQLPDDLLAVLRDADADKLEPGTFFTSSAAAPLVGALERSGYINRSNRSRLLSSTGGFAKEAAGDLIATFSRLVVPMELPGYLRTLVDRSALAWLVAAAAGQSWDFRRCLQLAIVEYMQMQKESACLPQWLEQATIETRPTVDKPRAAMMLQILTLAARKGSSFAKLARSVAERSRTGGADMFGAGMNSLDALRDAASDNGIEVAAAADRKKCKREPKKKGKKQ